MRRTRRHKFLQISVFFLIYSIIHVLSERSSNKTVEQTNESQLKKGEDVSKTDNENESKQGQDVSKTEGKHELKQGEDGSPAHDHKKGEKGERKDNNQELTNVKKPENEKKLPKGEKNEKVDNDSKVENEQKSTRTTDDDNTEKGQKLAKVADNGKTENVPKLKNEPDAGKSEKDEKQVSKSKNEDKGSLSAGNSTNSKTTKPPKNGDSTISASKGAANALPTNASLTSADDVKKVKTNSTCIIPAIEQFPRPLIGPSGRRHGGIIIHVLVAVYTFLGLAIVCDEYFVASLDRICEELKMSPDVAGATFMAAGSSAPELATVIIGVFFAKDDIGISGVIGSAVFNIMFVIAVCGLCTTTAVYLNWWPLVRDCFFYAVAILVMLITIHDEMISWGESLFMLIMYVVYCVALHYNSFLDKWAQTLPVPCKKIAPNEQSGLVSYKTLEEDRKHPSYGCSPEKPTDAFESDWPSYEPPLSGPALNQASGGAPPPPPPPGPLQQDYYRPKEYDPASCVDPLLKPTEGGLYRQATWAIVYPIHYLCKKTVPDCRSEQYKNWYPFTFFVSMIWISFYSYFMVWMITVIGTTCGIPDTVMGLTFVAAGVSVPDALSSIAVMKEGYGDMAVSNAVGSNVFDILICLGLPWFIKTAIIKPGSKVKVISKGLTYSTLSLLSTVVFLVVATHLNGWKLDRKYGIVLMVWYIIFITFASMYELNVFGYLNPPECQSEY